MNRPLIQVGDLIQVPERYYRFGTGELRMRVTYVPKSAQIPGMQWIELVGTTVDPQGQPGRARSALVRVAALRVPGRVLRPPEPLPPHARLPLHARLPRPPRPRRPPDAARPTHRDPR